MRLRDGGTRVPPALWLLLALGAALVVAADHIGPARLAIGVDGTGQLLVATGTWLACRRAAARPGAVAAPWRRAGRAALAWAVGELLLTVQHFAFSSVARPSPADLAFLVAAGFALSAPLGFPTSLSRVAVRTRVLLDGAVVVAASLFLVWILVIEPYLTATTSHERLAFQLLYPSLDIVVVAVVTATLAQITADHALSLGASALGLTVLAATNLVETCLAVGSTPPDVSPYDAGFVLGLGLVALGACVDGATAAPRLVTAVGRVHRLLPYLPLPAVAAVTWIHQHRLGEQPLALLFGLAGLMLVRELALRAEHDGLLGEHRRAMTALAESEQRYRRIVENAAEGIWVSDANGITRFVNSRMAQMLGLDERALVGQPTLKLLDGLLDDEGRAAVAERMADRAAGRLASYEFQLRRTDGSTIYTLVNSAPLHAPDGSIEGSLTMVSDISARKELEDRLVEQARTDALTGLGNRTLLNAVAPPVLATSGAALVYCDLDGFKAVNDSLGHPTGDVLLREVARRLRSCLRPGDIIVRLGGDEFAALLPGVTAATSAGAAAERMLEALTRPFYVAGRQLYVTASIGIAIGAPAGATVEQLLRDADLAMYAAKADGRGRHRVYEDDMHAAVARRLQLEQDLRRALDSDELQVWFQPVVALDDGRCVGAEALVRWLHPEQGLLSPDEFIPVAAEAGLMAALGRHVLAAATLEAVTWALPTGGAPTLSVNIGAQHLLDGSAAADVAGALAASGLDADRLLIELTERSLLGGSVARAAVRELHDLGCPLALDDFGTGYSSIAHLRDFPVQVVKLDRSFVATMTTDLRASRLVQAILQLAAILGISCTAEGVETATQARRLLAAGCTYAQGYLYAPALPAPEFRAWLATASAPVPHGLPRPRRAEESATLA